MNEFQRKLLQKLVFYIFLPEDTEIRESDSTASTGGNKGTIDVTNTQGWTTFTIEIPNLELPLQEVGDDCDQQNSPTDNQLS